MYVDLYVICVWNWNWWLTQDHFLIKHWSQCSHRCSAPVVGLEDYSLGLVSSYSTAKSGTLIWHEWGLWFNPRYIKRWPAIFVVKPWAWWIHCLPVHVQVYTCSTHDTIGLEYQVFLNFYVIYRSTVICKLSLHIFGNLIAHWLLASQGSFTPDARVSLGVFFVLEWVLNGRVWLLAQGNPWWNKPLKRIRRFLCISTQDAI